MIKAVEESCTHKSDQIGKTASGGDGCAIDSKGNLYITPTIRHPGVRPERQVPGRDCVPGAAGQRQVRRQGHEDAVRHRADIALHGADGGNRPRVFGRREMRKSRRGQRAMNRESGAVYTCRQPVLLPSPVLVFHHSTCTMAALTFTGDAFLTGPRSSSLAGSWMSLARRRGRAWPGGSAPVALARR
jgi:hypothetical protein